MIFWMAEVSNGFFSTGSIRIFICSPACLTVSRTAEPRLLISCTAPAKSDLLSVSIDCTASCTSRLTLRKTRSGARVIGVSRNEAPSMNSIVSTPLPCRINETNCRMLPSSSMMNASGERRSPAVAVASVGAEFTEGADIWVRANDRTTSVRTL